MVDDGGVEIPIVFKAHARSQRITLKRNFIDPPTIIYPSVISEATALMEISTHPAYTRLKAQMQAPVQNPILDGYKTRLHTFRFHQNQAEGVFAAFERGDVVDVYLPPNAEIMSHAVQRSLFKTVKSVLQFEGQRILPPLVSQRASELGLSFRRVVVRPMSTAWGRCKGDGSLTLSSPLLFYPDQYVSLVVDHELAHLTYLNHSPEFWTLLSRYRGTDALQEDYQMRSYQLPLPTVY